MVRLKTVLHFLAICCALCALCSCDQSDRKTSDPSPDVADLLSDLVEFWGVERWPTFADIQWGSSPEVVKTKMGEKGYKLLSDRLEEVPFSRNRMEDFSKMTDEEILKFFAENTPDETSNLLSEREKSHLVKFMRFLGKDEKRTLRFEGSLLGEKVFIECLFLGEWGLNTVDQVFEKPESGNVSFALKIRELLIRNYGEPVRERGVDSPRDEDFFRVKFEWESSNTGGYKAKMLEGNIYRESENFHLEYYSPFLSFLDYIPAKVIRFRMERDRKLEEEKKSKIKEQEKDF